MGGKGSGRRSYRTRYGSSGKSATGDSLPLDVRALQRDGRLQPGVYASWLWYGGAAIPENKIASITFRAHEGGVTLIYTNHGESVRQSHPRCAHGVQLWRFSRLVGVSQICARRVAIIYGEGKLFACRHCYRLCYFSQ